MEQQQGKMHQHKPLSMRDPAMTELTKLPLKYSFILQAPQMQDVLPPSDASLEVGTRPEERIFPVLASSRAVEQASLAAPTVVPSSAQQHSSAAASSATDALSGQG